MKLDNGSNVLLDTNTDGSHQFQITANATAFQILSSGLYSDKVRAVIRELACNAYDSHIAAGKSDVPITVVLPTLLDATFTVRDYGVGLDHEQVVSLYTNYFSSDKRNTNSLTGGFGLGSKSPFAYTDSFSVIARKNSVARLYLCHLNESGAPSLVKVSEEQTSDADGVDVSFAVKTEDILQFQSKAVHVLQWFDTRPDVVNLSAPWPVKDYLASTSSYAIPTSKHEAHRPVDGYVGMSLVKMGNVAYPLDWSRSMLGEWHSRNIVHLGLIELRLPIGAAAIAASREELQYDPKTCENIKLALINAVRDFSQFLVDSTVPSGIKTWASCVKADEIKKQLHDTFTRNFSQMLVDNCIGYSDVASKLFTENSWLVPAVGESHGVSVSLLRAGSIGKKVLRAGIYSTGKDSIRAALQYLENTAIVICDSNLVSERIAHARQAGTIRQALVFSGPKNLYNEVVKQATECSKLMGDLPIIYSSSLPVNTSIASSAGGTAKSKVVFVPVDNRPVAYFNFVDMTLSELPLGDVPEEGRYYITKITSGQNSGSYDVGSGKLWQVASDEQLYHELETFAKGTSALFARCPTWSAPRGMLIVRPVDIKRLKLDESGFVPWGTVVNAAFEQPEIVDLIDNLANEYDDIGERYQVNKYSYNLPWYALFRDLLKKTNNAIELWETFDKAELTAHVRGYLLADAQSAAVRDAVAVMQGRLKSLGLNGGKPMRSVEIMNQVLEVKYPMLSILNRQMLADPVASSNPAHIAKVLAGIFNI